MIILACLPILAGTGGLIGYLISKFTLEAQNSYALAGATAEQVLYGIRTVYSFSLQERFAALYSKQLVNARKTGVKRGVSLGGKSSHIIGISYFYLIQNPSLVWLLFICVILYIWLILLVWRQARIGKQDDWHCKLTLSPSICM